MFELRLPLGHQGVRLCRGDAPVVASFLVEDAVQTQLRPRSDRLHALVGQNSAPAVGTPGGCPFAAALQGHAAPKRNLHLPRRLLRVNFFVWKRDSRVENSVCAGDCNFWGQVVELFTRE